MSCLASLAFSSTPLFTLSFSPGESPHLLPEGRHQVQVCVCVSVRESTLTAGRRPMMTVLRPRVSCWVIFGQLTAGTDHRNDPTPRKERLKHQYAFPVNL